MTAAERRVIGVGLVGYGLAGRIFHAPFIQATEGLELKAVVTRHPDRVHERMPGVSVVPNLDALLALDDVELVVIASPDALHAEHALAALEAGKHVLIDKPFATSLAAARQVADEAERSGCMLTIFQNRRWDGDFLTLKRLVSDGVLGHIVHFESHFDRWRPHVDTTWKDARDGGSWFDLGPHLVDQALNLFGMPQAINADIAALRTDAGAPDWFHVTLVYPDRRAILHSSKLACDHELRFAVHGTRGSWIKNGFDGQEASLVAGSAADAPALGVERQPGRHTPAEAEELFLQIENQRGDYGAFWRALVAALRGDGPNPVPAREALAVMTVLEAGLESARLGKTVHISA